MTTMVVSGCGKKEETKSEDGKVHIQFMHQQVEQERQDAVQAVSYTHLDVYKRQSWVCAMDWEASITENGENPSMIF